MNVKLLYGDKQTEDSNRYNNFFNALFQFCNFVIIRQYKTSEIEQLLKAFYSSSIEKKGLKKA